MTTKTFTRRDSATAALRKLGVSKEHYNSFIKAQDGAFLVDLGAAQRSLEKPTKSKPAKAVAQGRTGGQAQLIRNLIAQGLDNHQIVEKLQLPEGKRHYPGWYRAQMNRKG